MAAEPIKLTGEEQAGIKLSPSGAGGAAAPNSDTVIANASIAGGGRILKREGNVITIDFDGQKTAAEELAAAQQRERARTAGENDLLNDELPPNSLTDRLPAGSKPMSEREGTMPAAPGAPAPEGETPATGPGSEEEQKKKRKDEETKAGEKDGQSGGADASKEPQKNAGEQKTAAPPIKGWRQAANQVLSPIMRIKNMKEIGRLKTIKTKKQFELVKLKLAFDWLRFKMLFQIFRIIVEAISTVGIGAAAVEIGNFIKNNLQFNEMKNKIKRLEKDLVKIDEQIKKRTQFFNAEKVNRRKEQELNARVAQQQKQQTQRAA